MATIALVFREWFASWIRVISIRMNWFRPRGTQPNFCTQSKRQNLRISRLTYTGWNRFALKQNPHFETFRPVGLRRYLRMSLQLSRSKLQCQYRVHELIPTQRQISKSSPSFEEWNPPNSDDFEIHPNELVGSQISSKIIIEDGKAYNQWDLFTDENGVKPRISNLIR